MKHVLSDKEVQEQTDELSLTYLPEFRKDELGPELFIFLRSS